MSPVLSLSSLFFGCDQLLTAWSACESRSRKGEWNVLFCSSSSTGTELNQRTPLGFFSPPSLVPLVLEEGIKSRLYKKRKKYEEKEDAGGGEAGKREAGELLWSTWILALFFALSTLSLSSCSFSLPPSLVLLSLSLSLSCVPGTGRTCCSSRALWLIRLHGCSPAAI